MTTPDWRRALSEFVYEATHLSPVEDDGSHWCKISAECLANGRAVLAQAIEAGTAETGTGSVHESAVGETDAPNPADFTKDTTDG